MPSSRPALEGAAANHSPSGRHYPGIDGLRTFAVLAVIAIHAGVPRAYGGFLGVDVFFVISGFVITLTLLREYERTGRVRLGQFYARRFWRLTPALVVLLVFAGVLEIATGSISASDFAREAGKAFTYTYNLWWAAEGTPFRPEMGLVHTWSLAVEEQFYLFWAPCLAIGLSLLARRGSRVAAALSLVILFAVARIVTVLALGAESGIRWPWSRLDELLMGAVLALVLHGARESATAARLRSPVIAGVAAVLLAAYIVSGPDEYGHLTAFIGLPAVYLTSAVLVGHSYVGSTGRSPVLAILSWGPVVWLGKRTYGLYLFHFPITYVADAQGLVWPVQLGLAIVGGVGLAAFSYRFVEQPLQRYGRSKLTASAGRRTETTKNAPVTPT